MKETFTLFSPEHLLTLAVLVMIGWWLMRKGWNSDEDDKMKLALMMSGVTFSSLLVEAIWKGAERDFNFYDDLPLFLCDITALLLPFVIWYRSRKWIGIMYFWAMAGTLQALITPDPDAVFPDFHFIRYFVTHGGIVITILFVIIQWKIHIRMKDLLNAIVYIQVYLISVHIFNSIFSTNYSYTLAKPKAATILDTLGAWPWYILWAELLMLVLFFIVFLPFLFIKEPSETSSVWE